MAAEQIHIYRQKIIETNAYKKMSFIQRKFVITRNNVKQIEHHLKLIENIGYAQWFREHQSTYTNYLIINDIVEHKKP